MVGANQPMAASEAIVKLVQSAILLDGGCVDELQRAQKLSGATLAIIKYNIYTNLNI